jgi:hypothetical protein
MIHHFVSVHPLPPIKTAAIEPIGSEDLKFTPAEKFENKENNRSFYITLF